MHLILFVYFVTLFISINNAQINNACRTPINESGRCVPIKTCSTLIDALKRAPKPLPQSLVDYLKKSHCGRQNNEHLVCCATRHITTSTESAKPTMIMLNNDNNNAVDSFQISKHPSLKLLSLDRCGRVSSDKISFGNITGLGEFPWMALLQYETTDGLQFQCGASLISSRYVLTAAHCVTGIQSKLVSVRLGEHDISKDKDCEIFNNEEYCLPAVQDIAVEKIIFHPNYNKRRYTNDIAIIRLRKEAAFNANVAPICLPLTSELQSSSLQNVIISGWGLTERGTQSKELLKANINITNNNICQQAFRGTGLIMSSSQWCGVGESRVDSCRGDSGGPMFFTGTFTFGKIPLRFVQYGVVSAGGVSCGETENLPGIYTKVSSYLKWILDEMRP